MANVSGPGGPPQSSKRMQQTQAQVDEVVDIMRVNVDKVLERDQNFLNLTTVQMPCKLVHHSLKQVQGN